MESLPASKGGSSMVSGVVGAPHRIATRTPQTRIVWLTSLAALGEPAHYNNDTMYAQQNANNNTLFYMQAKENLAK